MKNKAAQELGRRSAEKRFEGLTPEEISVAMGKLRRGKKKISPSNA